MNTGLWKDNSILLASNAAKVLVAHLFCLQREKSATVNQENLVRVSIV